MRNIFKGSIVLLLILLTGGCSKKYLDPAPKTALAEFAVFDTRDRVIAQVNGMYAFMKSGAFLGGRYFVYNDIRDENFIPKSSNGVTNFQTWNHTVVSSTNEVQNCWGAIYAAINAINVFNEGLDAAWTSGKLGGKITATEKDQFTAEGLALRAMCYFDLLQLYAKPYNMNTGANPGVPLRLTGNKGTEGNDLARSTVAEVYTQILTDLNTAESLATTTYGTTADLLNTTRIHKNTIIAFKTRVYLHMGNWAAVNTEAAKIVSAAAPFTAPTGVPFALNASYAALWATPYTSKENIFSMPFTTTNGPGTQNGMAHYYNPASSESYYLVTAAGSTFSKIDATDARKVMMVVSSSNTFLGKWPDFTTLTNYAPVMRYAEVLLNYSEALVRQGNVVTQKAVDLLNAVRTRSFTTGAYTLAGLSTVANYLTAVQLERDIEFLGEGLRNLDIMRVSATIPGKNSATMGNVAAIPTTSQSYIWPIPANEMNINKLMTPNN
jgi:starch-binding outer membrane protein, SusD/RagB family